jgi:hypothetical protein
VVALCVKRFSIRTKYKYEFAGCAVRTVNHENQIIKPINNPFLHTAGMSPHRPVPCTSIGACGARTG